MYFQVVAQFIMHNVAIYHRQQTKFFDNTRLACCACLQINSDAEYCLAGFLSVVIIIEVPSKDFHQGRQTCGET